MGLRAGLDWCGKSRRHRDSIPGPSSPYAVAIPTELPGPQNSNVLEIIYKHNKDKFSKNAKKKYIHIYGRGGR